MNSRFLRTLSCFLLFATVALAGQVETSYLDPYSYTDLKFVDRSAKTALKVFDRELKESKRIARALGPDRSIDLHFLDINMAGEILPSPRYQDRRVIRDVYPSKFLIQYVLKDAEGNAIRTGESEVVGLDTTSQIRRSTSAESFFYELDLLESWIVKL